MGKNASKSERSSSLPDASILIKKNLQPKTNPFEIEFGSETNRKSKSFKDEFFLFDNKSPIVRTNRSFRSNSKDLFIIQHKKEKQIEDQIALIELKKEHLLNALRKEKDKKPVSRTFLRSPENNKIRPSENKPLSKPENFRVPCDSEERKIITDLKIPFEQEMVSPRLLFTRRTINKTSANQNLLKENRLIPETERLRTTSNKQGSFQIKRKLSFDGEKFEKYKSIITGINGNGNNDNNKANKADSFKFSNHVYEKLNIKRAAVLKGKGLMKVEIVNENTPKTNKNTENVLAYLLSEQITPTEYFLRKEKQKNPSSNMRKVILNKEPQTSNEDRKTPSTYRNNKESFKISFPDDIGENFRMNDGEKINFKFSQILKQSKRRDYGLFLNVKPERESTFRENSKILLNKFGSIKRTLNLIKTKKEA